MSDIMISDLHYCTYCKQWKTKDNFWKNSKKTKTGLKTSLRNQCKDCYKIYIEEYKKKNPEKLRANARNSYHRNIDINRERRRDYYHNHADEISKKHKKYIEEHKEQVSKYIRINANYNLFTTTFRLLFKNKIQTSELFSYLSYTYEELKEHLEFQFDENMNWDNYGEYWTIDFILNKNLFDLTDRFSHDFKIFFSLKNIRPITTVKKKLRRPKDGSDVPENIKQDILGQTI